MHLGMIGLGKMGLNMAWRLLRAGHTVTGFDLSDDALRALAAEGGRPAGGLDELVDDLAPPRAIWLMVPAGHPVDQALEALVGRLDADDLIVDGGNSNYQDTLRRAEALREHTLRYADVGVSGGVWGLERGYSLMVGGSDEVVERLRPVLEALAPSSEEGWGHVGPVGAGHFVKMVHNGIEYGLMQAYAEGFALLDAKKHFGPRRADLDLRQIADVWSHGSVVRSWLLDLAARALDEDPYLENPAPYVPDSGEGRWAVKEAIDLDVPAPVITEALIQRLQSREENSYAFKLLSVLRSQFGGHAMRSSQDAEEER